jgi:hypothetical protein
MEMVAAPACKVCPKQRPWMNIKKQNKTNQDDFLILALLIKRSSIIIKIKNILARIGIHPTC